MAKSKYYLLTCDALDGADAERIGLVSMAVDDDAVVETAFDVARKLARGSQQAIRFTELALNNWLRQAGPAFDASVAMEMLGFAGTDVHEGPAAVTEKRRPDFAWPPGDPAAPGPVDARSVRTASRRAGQGVGCSVVIIRGEP